MIILDLLDIIKLEPVLYICIYMMLQKFVANAAFQVVYGAVC